VNVIQDPDGFFVRLVEGSQTLPDRWVGATLGITVAERLRLLKIYRDVLGFVPGPDGCESPHDCSDSGLPRIDDGMDGVQTADQQTMRTRLPDPGTTMLLVPVRDVEAAAQALKNAGLEIITAGGKAVTHDSGSKVIIVRDPNNIFLELIQRPPGNKA
jgi:hypothetical protein